MKPLKTDTRAGRKPTIDAGRLRWAMDGDAMLEEWHRANGQRNEAADQLPDRLSLRRLHDRGDKGVVLEFDAVAGAGEKQHRVRLFGEVPVGCAQKHFERARRHFYRTPIPTSEAEAPACNLQFLSGPGMVLRPPGLDERLPSLPFYLTSSRAGRRFGFGEVRSKLVSHRLGKRAVVRLSRARSENGSPKRIIVKLHSRRSRSWQRSSRIVRELGQGVLDGELVGVAPNLGLIEAHNVEAMAHVEAEPLGTWPAERALPGYQAAGQAIGRLHCGSTALSLNVHGVAQELDTLQRWLELIQALGMDSGRRFAAALSVVRQRFGQLDPVSPALIHRDFHEKQVLVGHDRAWLIDFDTACFGDPAIDVGNFLAHVSLAELIHDRSLIEHKHTFVDAYAHHRRLPQQTNIEAYLRASSLRLAFIYAFHDNHRRFVPSLLDRAEGV